MKTKPIGLFVKPGADGTAFNGTWTLTESGRVIARWRNRDMPKLGAFLLVRLEDAIRPVAQRVNAGRASATARHSNGTKADKIRDLAAALSERGLDPHKKLSVIARKVVTDPDYVRKVLKKTAD